MKNFKLFDIVALTDDLPAENLIKGQVGTIVEVYNEGEAFEVEFVNVNGETYGLRKKKSFELWERIISDDRRGGFFSDESCYD